jgi:phosphatidate cytidylyltransferase
VLMTRLLTAAVAIAILVPTLVFGRMHGVAALVAVLSTIAVWELAGHIPCLRRGLPCAINLALGLAVVAAMYAVPFVAVPAVLVGLPLLVLILHLFLYNVIESTVESSAFTILVLSYTVVPLGHAILLAKLDMGIAWVFFVLVVICLGDAGAYFTGKYIGKHHFSQRVSPGKTIEGLVGGLAGNLAGMGIMKLAVPELPGWWMMTQIALMLAVLGPIGDLCASAIKRRLDIKDFGSIMPGHGGVLDRADSLIPAFPATYYFLIITGQSIPL